MSQLTENSIICICSLGKPGNRRAVRQNEVNIQATEDGGEPDPTLLHLNRDLVAAPEFDAIVKYDRYIFQWLRQRSLPFPLKAGLFLVPTASVVEINSHLDSCREVRHGTLIPAYLQCYPERVAESKARLGALAKDSDYPEPEEVEDSFSWKTSWLALDVPRKLQQISASLFEKERAKAEKFWSDATTEIVANLYHQFSEAVQGWEKKLLNPTPQAFRTNSIEKLEELLTNLKQLNLPLGDAPLEELIQRAQNVIHGVTPDALKDSKTERERMLESFSRLKEDLAALVAAAPSRKLRLDLLRPESTEQPAH